MQKALVTLVSMFLASGVVAQANSLTYGGALGYSATPGTQANPANTCISDICGPPSQSNLFSKKYFDQVIEYYHIDDPKLTDFPLSTSKLFSDLLAELKNLSAEYRSWILQVAKYYAAQASKESLTKNEIQSKPAGLLLKMLHPGISIQDAMKAELNQAQRLIVSLKNPSPFEKSLFFNKTSPDRFALIAAHVAQGSVDENETREIIQMIPNIRTNFQA